MYVYQSKAGATTSPGLNSVITTFQVSNCEGDPVGDPIPVIQAAVMNKVLANICNADALIGNYNRVERWVLNDGEDVELEADTYHSISFKVITGTGTINIDADGAEVIAAGEAEEFTASTVIDQEIIIECTTGKIVVTALRDPDA